MIIQLACPIASHLEEGLGQTVGQLLGNCGTFRECSRHLDSSELAGSKIFKQSSCIAVLGDVQLLFVQNTTSTGNTENVRRVMLCHSLYERLWQSPFSRDCSCDLISFDFGFFLSRFEGHVDIGTVVLYLVIVKEREAHAEAAGRVSWEGCIPLAYKAIEPNPRPTLVFLITLSQSRCSNIGIQLEDRHMSTNCVVLRRHLLIGPLLPISTDRVYYAGV